MNSSHRETAVKWQSRQPYSVKKLEAGVFLDFNMHGMEAVTEVGLRNGNLSTSSSSSLKLGVTLYWFYLDGRSLTYLQ